MAGSGDRPRRTAAEAWLLAALLLLTATGFDPWQRLYRENRAGIEALQSDDPQRAVEHFAEAQSLAPDDPRVLFNLGNALARAGKLDDARTAWKRAADLAGRTTLGRDAWFNQGVAALASGDPGAAAGALARALMIDPGDEEARRNLELALRAQEQRQQQQRSSPQERQQQEQQRQQRSQSEEQQRQDRQASQGEQPRTGEERERPEESRPQPQAQHSPQERSSEKGRREERPPQGAAAERTPREQDRAMAERLLERLEQDEREALRRALRRGSPRRRRREKDW